MQLNLSYVLLTLLLLCSVAMLLLSLAIRDWAHSEVWKVRDDASNEAPVRSGDVEMGLLKMCSDADFGLGVRSDCLKLRDALRQEEDFVLATLSLSFLSLALLLLAVQMALSLYNMLAVPTENWLRDYGIVVVSIMEAVSISLVVILFATCFIRMRQDGTMLPSELQASNSEQFNSQNERLGYAFYLMFVELVLICVRTVMVMMFGSSVRSTRKANAGVVYTIKAATPLSDKNLMY